MKKSRLAEEPIAYALKQVELGMTVGEICRKMGVALGSPLRCSRRRCSA
jgi:putative transposase